MAGGWIVAGDNVPGSLDSWTSRERREEKGCARLKFELAEPTDKNGNNSRSILVWCGSLSQQAAIRLDPPSQKLKPNPKYLGFLCLNLIPYI